MGGKGGRCVRLTTLPLPCAVVMKPENLNFLEPSGSLQACNGTERNSYNTNKHTTQYFMRKILYITPTYYGAIILPSSGDDNNISVANTAINSVAMSWYQNP